MPRKKHPTQAEIAEHLGLDNTRRVRELLEKGAIPNPRTSTLDEIRLAAFDHYREQAAGRAGEHVDELQSARLRKETAAADQAEFEMAERRGLYVLKAITADGWAELLKAFQKGVRAIPRSMVSAGELPRSAAARLQQRLDGELDRLAGIADRDIPQGRSRGSSRRSKNRASGGSAA